MLRLHILASGSGGNAAIVENAATGEGVLIDCGICKRDFFARAEEAGFDLGRLRAVAAMHVSQENNTYRLPRETFEAVIAEHGLSTTVSVAFQNRLVTIG